ncbi:hypothetical protein FNV43_RR18251 [Rhamnella rubrinervis]|uniref:LOB domain-containing protein n=1 Tax=Rhamnella rubrinervis TaxID=2594499 RepID=A0A8K0E3D0_9ROSA|nr:hypothetical protein FNV43_RR18251 [Rhamnella rubrinervis]
MMSGNNGGGGPCGACKFLRRKCVKGCIFSPYFDSDQGTAHFAAVHKVFGASNASKLLLRIPPHKRLDAVVTLCYEALARIRDPVYGCVAHIFTLQQQVVNLQADLAYVQARLSTLQRLPASSAPNTTSLNSSSLASASAMTTTNMSMHFDATLQNQVISAEMTSYFDPLDREEEGAVDDGDLQTLAREFVSRYLPGVRFRPSTFQ